MCLKHKDRYKQLVSQSVTRPPPSLFNFLFPGNMTRNTISPTEVETAAGMEWELQLPESSCKISTAERKEMTKCESLLPIQALIAYRQQAVTETLLHAYDSSAFNYSKENSIRTERSPSSAPSSSSRPILNNSDVLSEKSIKIGSEKSIVFRVIFPGNRKLKREGGGRVTDWLTSCL